MSEVGVIHLVWAPLGAEPVERFVRSYREHQAGLEHRLVILLNGFEAPEAAEAHLQPLDGIEHERLFLERPTLDLVAYGTAAERVEAETLLFLNSHSELLAPDWLAKLHAASHGAGIVGATGSFERPHSILPWRRRRWPAWPNVHLRSNAFLLRRELMRSLRWPEVVEKRDAWALESGREGLTAQIRARGLDALVVDCEGVAYTPERWAQSATFRAGGQAKLLVSDNRTRQWEEADPNERERLTRLTWGDGASAAPLRPRTATA